ncbi:hypothetical protein [Spirillospora albida]|uniref:hypothetical protein n=1 Tax=Spirillospora albida TaxID=58123 RepID=UPI001B80B0D5|nr:hypothetical protein [Spirillospora albida]
MRRRMIAALLLAPALALGAQGCGGGGADEGPAGGKSDQDKMREFAQCMRKNGVDMQDPGVDGRIEIRASARPGQGSPGGDGKIEAAQKKCRHLMPGGGRPKRLSPEDTAKQRAFSKCMRDNGVTSFPDPQPDGGVRIEARKGSGLDPESREFKDAEKACRRHAPGGGRVAPGGSGG